MNGCTVGIGDINTSKEVEINIKKYLETKKL